jgi:hypothetical protein
MIEDTAPEGLSSPHTNALAASALKMGGSFWANVINVNPRTASVTARVRRIVLRTVPMPNCSCLDGARAGVDGMPYFVSHGEKGRDWQKYQRWKP